MKWVAAFLVLLPLVADDHAGARSDEPMQAAVELNTVSLYDVKQLYKVKRSLSAGSDEALGKGRVIGIGTATDSDRVTVDFVGPQPLPSGGFSFSAQRKKAQLAAGHIPRAEATVWERVRTIFR
jgi:hypothetical protein